MIPVKARRAETVEWANKYPDLPGIYKAHVEPAANQAHAEARAAEFRRRRHVDAPVVCRTVVTFTSPWLPPGQAVQLTLPLETGTTDG
jgi:hypothetical protein